MSAKKVILFYSKHNEKSCSLRDLIRQLNVDGMYAISVDPSSIKQSLLEDERYKITKVPSILVIDKDDFEVYKGKKLDLWINALLQNLQQYQAALQGQMMAPLEPQQQMQSFSGPPDNGTTTLLLPSDSEDDEPEGPSEQKMPREIVKQGASPKDIAAKMEQQREKMDKSVEEMKREMYLAQTQGAGSK